MKTRGERFMLPFMIVLGVTTVQCSHSTDLYIEGKEHIGAMVHLMEWSYVDIKNECDFLRFCGYNGIVVSPPVEHVMLSKSTWQERYMPISLKLETRSGTLEELKDMIYYCSKKKHLRVYVDLNLNNMLQSTIKGEVKGIAGSLATPSQHKYDGLTKEEFHKPCKLTKADYKDATKLRECEVDDLQDLDNDAETLQDKHLALMNQLIEMGVSGFRMMMAKYMYPKHLKAIYLQLNTTVHTIKMEKPLMIHDVNDLEESVVKAKDYEKIGTTTDYTYAKTVTNYFLKKKERNLDDLLNIGNLKKGETLMARENEKMVFLYNHITYRTSKPDFALPRDEKAFKMAMAFMLSWPYGIPLILSSYKAEGDDGAPQYRNGNVKSPRPENVSPEEYEYICTQDYNCEHRIPVITNMTRFNKEVKDEPLTKVMGNKTHNWFAYARGDVGFIFFNAGDTDKTKSFHLDMKPGEYCDIASGYMIYNECTGKKVTVDKNGLVTITLEAKDENGYFAIYSRSRIDPFLKGVKGLMQKDPDVYYFGALAGQGLIWGGRALGRRAKAIKDTMGKPEAGAGELLDAAAGSNAEFIRTAGDGLYGAVKGRAQGLLAAQPQKQA